MSSDAAGVGTGQAVRQSLVGVEQPHATPADAVTSTQAAPAAQSALVVHARLARHWVAMLTQTTLPSVLRLQAQGPPQNVMLGVQRPTWVAGQAALGKQRPAWQT